MLQKLRASPACKNITLSTERSKDTFTHGGREKPDGCSWHSVAWLVPPSGHSCRTHSLSEGCSYGVSGTSERRFGSQHKQLTLREGEEKFRMDVAGDCGHESNRSKGDNSLSLIALSKLLLEKLITELLTV